MVVLKLNTWVHDVHVGLDRGACNNSCFVFTAVADMVLSILCCSICNCNRRCMGAGEKELKFNCSGCGACCKRVGKAISYLKELNFPYKAKKDGSCEMLDEDNKCKVYDNRPEVCSIDRMYEKVYKEEFKSKKEFYLHEAKQCNIFVSNDKLDKKYLIDLKPYQ